MRHIIRLVALPQVEPVDGFCVYNMNRNYYRGIHKWLFRNFGKANCCEYPKCKKNSTVYQWALIKRKKYIRKITNYWMLCSSCHHIYDDLSRNLPRFQDLSIELQEKLKKQTSERMKKNPVRYWLGKKMSPETIAKMIKARTGSKRSPETKEKMRLAALKRYAKKCQNPAFG